MALVVSAGLLVSGCAGAAVRVERGWLPTDRNTTNQTSRIMTMWNGSWIAALAVGVLVWGLTLWCVVAYRRRRGEQGLPLQVRYNLPLEILYTVVPLIMVAVLFYFTARDQVAIAATNVKPDVTIDVVAKQWSWDFNYVNENVYDGGVMAELTGAPGVEREAPTLYLPVNQRVQFNLTSRDVIHSFWIPAFRFKRDMIPGTPGSFRVDVADVAGYYPNSGVCAEFCGLDHSSMRFSVRILPPDEFEQWLIDEQEAQS